MVKITFFINSGMSRTDFNNLQKFCVNVFTSWLQSSQVDLLAKSEICKGVAVVCDAAGISPLGGSEPQEILKNGSS